MNKAHSIPILDGKLGIKRLWQELYWLKMKYDRICPICHEQLESGKVSRDYLVWHLEQKHPEVAS